MLRSRLVVDELVGSLTGDMKTGADILGASLEAPLRIIANNAGAEGAVVVAKIRSKDDPKYGFNAQTGEFEDVVAAGVIDPTKVVRVALQNAASVAGLLITTETAVAELPEKAVAAPGGGYDEFD